jgi:hypothetical protein
VEGLGALEASRGVFDLLRYRALAGIDAVELSGRGGVRRACRGLVPIDRLDERLLPLDRLAELLSALTSGTDLVLQAGGGCRRGRRDREGHKTRTDARASKCRFIPTAVWRWATWASMTLSEPVAECSCSDRPIRAT